MNLIEILIEEIYNIPIMIKQMQRSKTSDKQKKNTFVPFQNERDSLGRIIQQRVCKKNQFNIMELFENLRKSTKEYFFEKEFQKMSKKFELFKKNLSDNQDYDYEKQVNKCIEIADKLVKNKAQDEKNRQNLYINLRRSIDKKINRVTTCLNRLKTTGRNKSQDNILRQLQNEKKQINIQLFKSLSPKSQMMAKFCANGLKYSSMVDQKKFNPWKTWYKNEQFELFPGKKVGVKTRLKSIYE